MKAVVLATFAVVATLAAGYVVVPEKEVKFADKDFLLKQKAILEVFQHVHQKEVHTKLWADSKTYKIEENYPKYDKVELVKDFVEHFNHGRLIEFDVPFTPLYEEHMEEAKMLFNVFYYAKDWETFYKTIEWAR